MEVDLNQLTASLVTVSPFAPSPVPDNAPTESQKRGDNGDMRHPADSDGPVNVVDDSKQPIEAMPAKIQEFSFEQAEKSRPPIASLINQRHGYLPTSRMYWRLPSHRNTPGKWGAEEKKLTAATSSSSILSWLSELEDAVEMSTSATSVSNGERQGMFPPGKTLGLQVPHVQDLGNSCDQQQGTVGGGRQCGNPEKRATNSRQKVQSRPQDSNFITYDNSCLSYTTPPLTHPAFQGRRGFDPWKRRIEFNRAHYPVSVRQTLSDVRQTVPQLQAQASTRNLSKVISAPMVIKQMEPLPRDSTENLPNITPQERHDDMTPVETMEREETHRYMSGCQDGRTTSPWMCEDCCERERKARKADGCHQGKHQSGRSSLKTAKIWIGRKIPTFQRCAVTNVVPFQNRLVEK
ncbi:uncharacterized protein LOC118427309 [Branchiostoma floridae]|uniref:Uncharacterized protein LOC118427309 n=1 Tax=Branchiostoma floridae TaxID=7739 RepID=A0A9J7N7Q1_BRAFL|nr:uncharacterized protein LOC118427309 [Branchiostoma floridae]